MHVELVERRRQLDADIQDLRRIIDRHEGQGPQMNPRAMQAARQARLENPPAPAGAARQAILDLLEGGAVWTASDIARVRGTTPPAASAALKRLLREEPPKVERVGRSGWRLKQIDSSTNGSKAPDGNRLFIGSAAGEAESEGAPSSR
jgi:hypothetical protein